MIAFNESRTSSASGPLSNVIPGTLFNLLVGIVIFLLLLLGESEEPMLGSCLVELRRQSLDAEVDAVRGDLGEECHHSDDTARLEGFLESLLTSQADHEGDHSSHDCRKHLGLLNRGLVWFTIGDVFDAYENS